MKTFELKIRGGETINKIEASSVEEAVEKFAKIKKLTIDSLLELFVVDELVR